MDPIEDVDVPGLLCDHPRILQKAWRVQNSSAIIHGSYRKYGQLRAVTTHGSYRRLEGLRAPFQSSMDPIESLEISGLLCDHT